MGLGVLGKITRGDELAIAYEIGKSDRVLIEHLKKPCRPAAMLNVGLAVGVRCREKCAGLRLDEVLEFRRDLRLPSASMRA